MDWFESAGRAISRFSRGYSFGARKRRSIRGATSRCSGNPDTSPSLGNSLLSKVQRLPYQAQLLDSGPAGSKPVAMEANPLAAMALRNSAPAAANFLIHGAPVDRIDGDSIFQFTLTTDDKSSQIARAWLELRASSFQTFLIT